jgi:hypothetical protein
LLVFWFSSCHRLCDEKSDSLFRNVVHWKHSLRRRRSPKDLAKQTSS